MLQVQEYETRSTGLPKHFFFLLTFHKDHAASSGTFPDALHCAQEDPVLHQCVSRKEEEEQEVGKEGRRGGREEGRKGGGKEGRRREEGRRGGREEGRRGGREEGRRGGREEGRRGGREEGRRGGREEGRRGGGEEEV